MSLRIERIIDHRLYPREAVANARQAYRSHCNVRITRIDSNLAKLEIQGNGKNAIDDREAVLSFLNYILDRSAQIHFATA